MTHTIPFNLNKNQIAFILYCLEFFDKEFDDYDFEEGKYGLTSQECNEIIQKLQSGLDRLP